MSEAVLVFIDPGYLPDIGHYQNYARAIRRAAEDRQICFTHYVSLGVPKTHAAGLQLERWFPCRATLDDVVFDDQDRRQFFIDSFAARLLAIVRKLCREHSADVPIRVFMYTGHPILLPVIGRVMNAVDLNGRDIYFQFNLFYVSNAFALKIGCEGYAMTLVKINQELAEADPAGRVRLTADSQRIINVYRRYFSRSMALLPIPLGFEPEAISAQRRLRETVTLGYLGYTQVKQGYPFMRRLYHDMLDNPDWAHVSMKVRHNLFNIDAAMSANLEDLVGSNDRIDNAVNYQLPEEYDAFFRECDILLIPHQRTAYPLQTSGMFIDALCRGKPVVAPGNTWLSDQLQEYGAGVTFSGLDYDSFKAAVAEAIAAVEDLQARACRNIDAFAASHSPAALLDILFGEEEKYSPGQSVGDSSLKGDGMELLSLEVLERDAAVTEMVYFEKLFRRRNLGWHYMLDLVWIACQLKDLAPGSLVLDAGAGNGLLQYVLLRMGLRVISVDFIVRQGPDDVNWLAVSAGEVFDNDYIQHLKQNYSATGEGLEGERTVHSRDDFMALLDEGTAQLLFYRSDVSAMSLLADELVDAVVSVSALEHNPHEVTARAVEECLRVLKPGGRMVTTTSAAQCEDWYHRPSKGWCYSESSLKSLFQLDESAASNYHCYERMMFDLCQPGNELHVQLAPFYFTSGNNGMPWGRWEPKYLPVGTRKIKAKS